MSFDWYFLAMTTKYVWWSSKDKLQQVHKNALHKKETCMNAIMTSRQAAELDFAFERNGYTADDVKKLSSGNLLAQLLPIVRGNAEVKIVRRWYERDGVIYFSVTSDGTTGENWITRLESKGFRVGDYAKQVLRSPDFKPTNGVTTEVAVLKGMLFEDNNRITKRIRAEADKRKLSKPNPEVACLIRDMFSDDEIKAVGLYWVVVMHEPIKDSDGDPRLLGSAWIGDDSWLDAYYAGNGWDRENGFAFVVPPQ